MRTKFIFLTILSVSVFSVNAQTKARSTGQTPKLLSYAKQKQLSELPIEGWKSTKISLIDTTDEFSCSLISFRKSEPMSNNFKGRLIMNYGGKVTTPYNGNVAAYKKRPPLGLGSAKERMKPNTKDSVWVVNMEGKKVIMNYYYIFFTDESGKTKAKSTMLAYYDDGVNEIKAELQPEDIYILSKNKTEAEFKSQLPQISELEQEVTKAMQVFLKNI